MYFLGPIRATSSSIQVTPYKIVPKEDLEPYRNQYSNEVVSCGSKS